MRRFQNCGSQEAHLNHFAETCQFQSPSRCRRIDFTLLERDVTRFVLVDISRPVSRVDTVGVKLGQVLEGGEIRLGSLLEFLTLTRAKQMAE